MAQYIPHIVLLCIQAMATGIAIAQHGKPQQPRDASLTVGRIAILQLILWWGGWYASQH